MSRPRINQHLTVNAQATTVIRCETKCILSGNRRTQFSGPTNRQRRFRQEGIRRLVGRRKVDPFFFTHFRSSLQLGIVKILGLQSFRKTGTLYKFHSIYSRLPWGVYHFYIIAYPVFNTLQYRDRSDYRQSAIITKLTATRIDAYHCYGFYLLGVKRQHFLLILE